MVGTGSDATLNARCNCDRFVRSVQALLELHDKIEGSIAIVGKGQLFHEAVERFASDKVTFLGWRHGEELYVRLTPGCSCLFERNLTSRAGLTPNRPRAPRTSRARGTFVGRSWAAGGAAWRSGGGEHVGWGSLKQITLTAVRGVVAVSDAAAGHRAVVHSLNGRAVPCMMVPATLSCKVLGLPLRRRLCVRTRKRAVK